MQLHPVPGHQRVVFLKPLVTDPRIEVGDYTYYDDPDDPLAFERDAFLYGYGPERLLIGRYCVFGEPWAERTMDLVMSAPSRGDTVVGHDVWLGYGALVMPGVNVGSGAVVAARSVVAADVPAYAIVAGNPARVVRRRYEDDDVERLLRAAWWDWPVELVTEHARTIMAGEPAELERVAGELS